MNAAQIIRPVIRPATAHTVLLLTDDGGVLCRRCTRNHARRIIESTRRHPGDGWAAVAHFHHAEGAPIRCDHCGEPQAADYGISLMAQWIETCTADYWQGSDLLHLSVTVDPTTTPVDLCRAAAEAIEAGAVFGPDYDPDDAIWHDAAAAAILDMQARLLERHGPAAMQAVDPATYDPDAPEQPAAFIVFRSQ